jgi:hypothetical protein
MHVPEEGIVTTRRVVPKKNKIDGESILTGLRLAYWSAPDQVKYQF